MRANDYKSTHCTHLFCRGKRLTNQREKQKRFLRQSFLDGHSETDNREISVIENAETMKALS